MDLVVEKGPQNKVVAKGEDLVTNTSAVVRLRVGRPGSHVGCSPGTLQLQGTTTETHHPPVHGPKRAQVQKNPCRAPWP